MTPTGTHITYLQLCARKLWLFHHGIQMEHSSELVAEGRFIDETSYPQRADRWQALEIEGIKLDHYDPKLGIVREVKKSPKKEAAHVAQVKYYLFVLERNGILAKYGLLEYPKLRETTEVYLEDADRQVIPEWEKQVSAIVGSEDCPPVIHKPMCKQCAYFEFCYVEE